MASATAAVVTVFALFISATAAATVYTNHTVGGTNGWFFNATVNTSAANYSDWAANQTFNLGDYLIFNTNSNQTVIQTYNLTTYQNCSADDSDNGTFVYNSGDSRFGEALAIAVPLTIEGPNYYFSDASDGVQCQNGMAFEINVKHGLGLPPSLNQPPPPPYIEPPGPDTADSPPVTLAQPPSNAFTAQANVRQVLCCLCASLLYFRFH
ncbi:hypothetical protein QN277_022817 [Acacia crassicarpa]|nr:hypothetical protein QN277_022817 [Acacia crassicarpa]